MFFLVLRLNSTIMISFGLQFKKRKLGYCGKLAGVRVRVRPKVGACCVIKMGPEYQDSDLIEHLPTQTV